MGKMLMDLLQQPRTKALIQVAVISALFLILCWPILPALYLDWIASGNEFESDNSHGILVPFICLYLAWHNRKEIPWVDAKASNAGLLVLIIAVALYLIGYAGGVFIIPRVALVFTVIGLVLYNLGKRVFRSLIFPIAFLFFMIPVPYSILSLVSLPLQKLVAITAGSIIRDVFALPVFREGNMLYFANTSLEVAEACSGIRSLITFLMLGSLFAHISDGSRMAKVILLAMSVPLAFLTNLLRVTGTGILAYFFGGVVASGFLHTFSGFVVLGFGIVLMVGLWKLMVFMQSRERRQGLTPKKESA